MKINKNVYTRLNSGEFGVNRKELLRMAGQAARVTSPNGNYRYKQFFFRINGDWVDDVVIVSNQSTESKQPIVFEACLSCEGVGCKSCNYQGGKQVTINYNPDIYNLV